MESISVVSVHRIGLGRFRNAMLMALGILLIVAAAAPSCRGQNFSEWFRQKKTQQKYLLEQIAALQVYIGFAKKGYDLVGSGIETVRSITSGEFSLHELFISGLKKVSPLIRDDGRVAEIVAMQLEILGDFNRLKNTQGLRPDQIAYVSSVAGLVMGECYGDLEELLLVVSSGKVEMTDNERLVRLSGIYERMLDRSSFSRRFSGEFGLLLRQQKIEAESLNKLRRYYGID